MHQALLKLSLQEKHPPVAVKPIGPEGTLLRLRTINIDQDLQHVYAWMDDPDVRVNWRLQENRHRLDSHYQLFLESAERQSFLIEKAEEPLFQFDIFLICYHELYFRIPTTTGDCIWNFIVRMTDERMEDMEHAINLQLEYFFASPECRRLWLPIREDQVSIQEVFVKAGFRYRASYTARMERFALFYLRRADYLSARERQS